MRSTAGAATPPSCFVSHLRNSRNNLQPPQTIPVAKDRPAATHAIFKPRLPGRRRNQRFLFALLNEFGVPIALMSMAFSFAFSSTKVNLESIWLAWPDRKNARQYG